MGLSSPGVTAADIADLVDRFKDLEDQVGVYWKDMGTASAWVLGTYDLGDYVTGDADEVWVQTNPDGASGLSEPDWAGEDPGPVTDGALIWVRVTEWVGLTHTEKRAVVQPVTPNQHWYEAQTYGKTGGTGDEPTWTTDGTSVYDVLVL